MNENIDSATIIAYLDRLNPQNPLEVVKTSGQVKALSQALMELIERVNVPRQIKLWEEEAAGLKRDIDRLLNDVEQAKALDTELRSLEEQKNQLQEQKEMIEDLSTQKDEIQRLEAFVATHDLSALQQELEKLRSEADGEIDKVKQWITEVKDCFGEMSSPVIDNIRQILRDLEKNQNQLDKVIDDSKKEINLKKVELSKSLQSYDVQILEAQNGYNELVTQLNGIKTKLLEVREKHSKNVSSYEIHFAQNKAIWGELGKRHNLNAHVNQLIEETERNLLRFDREIKSLIEKIDHLTVF
jgi:DNA repair exonuclease SbcCD ATPase subunit